MSSAPQPTACAPVVLLVFRRPEHTRQMLERVRAVRPAQLLVVADGPRADRPDEAAKCAEVRSLVERMVDWGPELLTCYAEANMGLRRRVSTGLTWAFQQVDRAIILEDDCVPDVTFFQFCTELLAHYQHDTRIGVITGDNFQQQPFACDASYYFSRYAHCWGWATWRRAWRHYDDDMTHWPALRDAEWLNDLFPSRAAAAYWKNIFEKVFTRRQDSWAFPWLFSLWSQSMLTATPRTNLVCNIGADAEGTHTTIDSEERVSHKTSPMTFPLVHPGCVVRSHRADNYVQEHMFGTSAKPKRGLFSPWFRKR